MPVVELTRNSKPAGENGPPRGPEKAMLSQASRSTTAACPVFLRRRRASTAASQICQEKWRKHVWPPLWRRRMTSRLKTILSWYEGADRGCRHEIFRDIFLLAFGSSAAQGLVDFQAYDAEQAFLPGVEHARP